jgi:hypothetical protein
MIWDRSSRRECWAYWAKAVGRQGLGRRERNIPYAKARAEQSTSCCSEEFCEIFRAKDKTTGKLHTCKKFQKRDGRKVRKAAKNEIGILKM